MHARTLGLKALYVFLLFYWSYLVGMGSYFLFYWLATILFPGRIMQ